MLTPRQTLCQHPACGKSISMFPVFSSSGWFIPALWLRLCRISQSDGVPTAGKPPIEWAELPHQGDQAIAHPLGVVLIPGKVPAKKFFLTSYAFDQHQRGSG